MEIEQYSFGPYGPFVSLKDHEQALQQLMEKAVRFADRLDAMDKNSSVHWNDVDEFLKSPEVQAWKEQQK